MRKRLLFICTLFTLTASAQISKPRREYVEFLISTNHIDRNYQTGQPAYVKLQAFAGGVPLENTYVHYTHGDEMMSQSASDSILIRGGEALIPVGTRQEPGFRTCHLHFQVNGREYKDMVKVAYSPERIQPVIPMPEDFEKFWNKVMKKTRSLPMEVEVTPLPQYDTPTVKVSLVKLLCGENGRSIYGYLSQPKKEGKYPVLFSPPGAGVKKMGPSMNYAEKGFISLNIEIHGFSPEISGEEYKELNKKYGDYMYVGLNQPQEYYYKDVYAGCVRAIDYLCSLPQFDGKNVCVTGGSQGGALSIVTAALHPQVTCVAAYYPAMSDMNGFLHERAGGWPKFFRDEETIAKMNGVPIDQAVHTLSYYDVVNFAKLIKVPGFYSFGYNDETCSATSIMSVINSVRVPKKVVITPTSGHWRFPATNEESIEWMKEQCK
jgi:cephalosporin-C deacetylase-like acetyl esterase